MSFDWVTFAFQLINVGVLLAILRYLLFRPVSQVIAQRQAETDAVLNAAEKAKAEAEAAKSKAEAEAQANIQTRQTVLEQARSEADELRKAIEAEAHRQADKIVADGKAALQQKERESEKRTLARARELAIAIAERALSAQAQGPAGYLAKLAEALKALPAPEREALLDGANLRLVSAKELSGPDKSAALEALKAYGCTPAFEVDPHLIAGLELHSENGKVRNSTAHDIEQIAEAMRHAPAD